jgi:hypothetical protein
VIAGADMVLFSSAGASVATDSRGIAAALDAAVRGGTMSRQRLIAAAGHVLAPKPVHLSGKAPA